MSLASTWAFSVHLGDLLCVLNFMSAGCQDLKLMKKIDYISIALYNAIS